MQRENAHSVTAMFLAFMKLDALSAFSVIIVFTMVVIIAVRVQFETYARNLTLQTLAQAAITKTSTEVYHDVEAAAVPINRLPDNAPSKAPMNRTFINSVGEAISNSRIIGGVQTYVSDSLGSTAITDNDSFLSQTWSFLGGNPATQRIQGVANLGNTNVEGENINCRLAATDRNTTPRVIGAPPPFDPATIPDADKWKYTIREVCDVSDAPWFTLSDWIVTPSPAQVVGAMSDAAQIVSSGLVFRQLFV